MQALVILELVLGVRELVEVEVEVIVGTSGSGGDSCSIRCLSTRYSKMFSILDTMVRCMMQKQQP